MAAEGKVSLVVDHFLGDGVQTIFGPMSTTVDLPEDILVFVGSIYQIPGDAYTVIGANIVFSSPVPNGVPANVIHNLGSTVTEGCPVPPPPVPPLSTPENLDPSEEALLVLESWCDSYVFLGSVPSDLGNWSAADFEVSMDPTFLTGVVFKDTGTFGGLTVDNNPYVTFLYADLLPTNETYYWRVRYYDSLSNPTDWSTPTSFDVADSPLNDVDQPENLFPGEGDTVDVSVPPI